MAVNVKRQEKKFNFFIPLEFEKSKGEDGKELVKIKGVASSAVTDSDGELLEPSGFDFAPLMESGFLNWNHQGQKTSKAICGEPTAAKIINKGKDFYIEGVLYPNEEGKYVADLAETLEKHSPKRRLGFSIEGVPTAIDPFNKKRITKARVTGVAITQCPKNPNTLLSIMKGEYTDAFQDPLNEEEEDQEKDKKEKAMTTEAIAPATPEHVEGGEEKLDQVNKDRAKKVGSYLRKSEIYGIIFNRFDVDTEKAQDVYTLIEHLNENVLHMEKGTITNETIEKAYEILALAKGKNEGKLDTKGGKKGDDLVVDVDDKDAEDLAKSKDAKIEGSEIIEKSDTEKEQDKKKFEKAKEIAGVFHKGGMSKEDTENAMEKAGYDVKIAGEAYDSCVADANANKDGGKLEGMSIVETGIVKSLISAELKSTNAVLARMEKSNADMFQALGTILKSTLEENQILKSNMEGALTTIGELNTKLDTIGSQRGQRKSLQTATPRFEGEAGTTIQKGGESVPMGCEAFNINSKDDLKRLSKTLSSKLEIMKSQGGDTNLVRRLEDTVLEIETGYFVDPQMFPTLRNMNIILQKPE